MTCSARRCIRSSIFAIDPAKRKGIRLRQSYLRVPKQAAIMVGRYTHAHQFKRARRALKFLRTRLGRVIRDIRRKIEGNPGYLRSRAVPSALRLMPLRIRRSMRGTST